MHTMSRVDKKRTSLIERLLKANDDFPLLAKELSRYEWDFGGIPVLLEKEHVEDILERYVEGKIDADFLHEWAEFIELRDDIDYPEEDEAVLLEIVHALATPHVEGELTSARAKAWIEKL